MNAVLKLGRSNWLCRLSGRSRGMGVQDGNSFQLPLLIFIVFFTCIFAPSSSQLMSQHDENGVCATVNCSMGTCRETPLSFPFFTCDCYPGWTMPRVGAFVWPSCIWPNCTIHIDQCGGQPPTAAPPPPPPPFINLSAPCLFPVLCGDGTCVASGTSYQCQCPQGSGNLMGLPNLPCLQKCGLGADCNDITIGAPVPSSSGNGNSSPPSPSASPGHGSTYAPNCSKIYRTMWWTSLAVMVVLWI